MSKEKTPKLKRKTTAFDVVTRVITCGVAAAIPVALYCLSLIYYEFESSVIKLISSITGNSEDSGITYGYITVKNLIKDVVPALKAGNPKSASLSDIWEAFAPLHAGVYATLALLAVALILVLAIIIVSLVSNSNKLPFAFALIGFAVSIGVAIAFRQVTAPIVDGSFKLTDTVMTLLFNAMFGGTLGAELLSALFSLASDYIVKFTVINLSTAWITMCICFFAILVWHGAVLLMSLGEGKTPKEPLKEK